MQPCKVFRGMQSCGLANWQQDPHRSGSRPQAVMSSPYGSCILRAADLSMLFAGKDRQVTSASEYLQKTRTYQGLEAPIVGAETKPVIKAVQGQSGRAAQYQHEPSG